MCSGFRCQQTNRPEVDAGTNPAGAAESRRRTITGKTTAGKAETYMEYHKGMNDCLFLDYCRRLSAVSVKNGRPGTHGRFFVGSAVQRPAGIERRTADSPCRFSYKVNTYPVKNFYRVNHRLEQPTSRDKNCETKKRFFAESKKHFLRAARRG